ncbi:methyltransferase family protein [Kribbella amoyensis]|uniref:Arsenite methyltransferase n=1 Tax=Kribbella amoyensis TaxID=996641 RepID=A0A561BYS8_9ACTN|nr:methyltransferase domain-containing protein [Kribbella amoyensis]TWD84018.1 methyltransferase family protein [Kribbella amoyensis]
MATMPDTAQLVTKVRQLYRQVAENPRGDFHFELGEQLALRLGYEPVRLAALPGPAVESFAGVGYFFDLANLQAGETVLDLGSGSGMDAFYAAGLVGAAGRVIGVDFTPEQTDKARRLAGEADLHQVEFLAAPIERLPWPDETVDCVISNGVINLCANKAAVFAEAARVLKPGGRMAIADIISEAQLTESIVGNADLWASCIGGATQEQQYLATIEAAGFTLREVRDNPYEFLSEQARTAGKTYGVKSVSVLAVRKGPR